MDRHLSPAETAKRFGISIKALRLYEQRGLLTPIRTNSGATGSAWRAYGPDEIARLHQILALKRLGLSLGRIGELLKGRDVMAPILALQEQALERDGERLSRALKLVKAARAKLASGGALSIDDLINLTKETVMQSLTDEERKELLSAIPARHFSAEEIETLKQRDYDPAAAKPQWDALLEELKGFVASNADPASPSVQDMARRWNALMEQFTGGDPALRQKVRAVWKDAMADSRTAPLVPITPELWTYIGAALRHLKSTK